MKVNRALGVIEQALAGGEHLVGAFSLADISIASILLRSSAGCRWIRWPGSKSACLVRPCGQAAELGAGHRRLSDARVESFPRFTCPSGKGYNDDHVSSHAPAQLCASTVLASPAAVTPPRPVAAHVRVVAQGGWRQPVQPAQPAPARPAPPPPVAYPTQAPPPPVVERVTRRRGWIRVAGNHEWRGGRYVWVGGHWERDRSGYQWQQGRWDWQANRYVWIPGSWVVVAPPPPAPAAYVPPPPPAPVYVDTTPPPPPAPTYEVVPAPRPGFDWVPGAHVWRGGRYVWAAGRWEPERRGYRWRAGSWAREGNRHVWREGTGDCDGDGDVDGRDRFLQKHDRDGDGDVDRRDKFLKKHDCDGDGDVDCNDRGRGRGHGRRDHAPRRSCDYGFSGSRTPALPRFARERLALVPVPQPQNRATRSMHQKHASAPIA